MPVTTQIVSTSGQAGNAGEDSWIYVTYSAPVLGYQYGQFDRVPGLVFLSPNIKHKQDNQGNLITTHEMPDGSDSG